MIIENLNNGTYQKYLFHIISYAKQAFVLVLAYFINGAMSDIFKNFRSSVSDVMFAMQIKEI